jgi:hypothetical protein
MIGSTDKNRQPMLRAIGTCVENPVISMLCGYMETAHQARRSGRQLVCSRR